VAGHLSLRALARATGQNAETVRRYMKGAMPSMQFLGMVCEVFEVEPQWLLLGEGPRERSAAVDADPDETGTPPILLAIKAGVDQLNRRMDVIESALRAQGLLPPPDAESQDARNESKDVDREPNSTSDSTDDLAPRIAASQSPKPHSKRPRGGAG